MKQKNENEVKNLPAFDLMIGVVRFPRAIVDDFLSRAGSELGLDPAYFAYGNLELQVNYTAPLRVCLSVLDFYRKEFSVADDDSIVKVVLHPHVNPGQYAR